MARGGLRRILVGDIVRLRFGIAIRQQVLEPVAGARDPALHRTHRHAGVRGDDVIGLALDDRQQQRLALGRCKLCEGGQELAHDQSALLMRRMRKRLGDRRVDRNGRTQAAQAGNELVALNTKQPGGEIGAQLEALTAGQCLGLSMVYGFVRQSSGHIRIDSAIGQGTSVKLYLPRTLDAIAERQVDATTTPTGREHILVVEDHDDVRLAVGDLLKGWGYRVTLAENAEAAAALLNEGAEFDLLFTDVVMPGTMPVMEMVRLAQRLRPDIAILLTTGYARDLIPEQGDGDYSMIAKPYGGDALAAKVRGVLAARRTLPRAAPPPTASTTGAPRRVLLVEDEVLLRMSVSDMLERLGCSVEGVGSAEQALDILARDDTFDLLLTDLGLPGMSGEDLAAEVGRRYSNLPVVIASGYGRPDGQPDGWQFITKPYSSVDLQQVLDHAARTADAG